MHTSVHLDSFLFPGVGEIDSAFVTRPNHFCDAAMNFDSISMALQYYNKVQTQVLCWKYAFVCRWEILSVCSELEQKVFCLYVCVFFRFAQSIITLTSECSKEKWNTHTLFYLHPFFLPVSHRQALMWVLLCNYSLAVDGCGK